MKSKFLIFILIIGLVVGFAGCKKDNGPEIAGIVTEVSESGGFRVMVIGGYAEDLMQVHLDKKIKYEEGIDETIKVGNAVGFIITGDVAESYPVQATATKILWNEPVITGKILSAGETSILVQVESGFDSKMLQALITGDTIFYNNIPNITEKGKSISFTITGEIMESDPPQVYVKRFVNYE
jgi:hypothetical protein